jgi:predicted DCC family thiol-disulfide oxidoreductase YuxK
VRFILRHDKKKKFTFAALQGQTARSILQRSGHNPEALDTMYVVLNSDEGLPARSDAAMFIGRELGGAWRALAEVFGIFPVASNWMYRLIASNRYKFFGRDQVCPLPDASVRARFFD